MIRGPGIVLVLGIGLGTGKALAQHPTGIDVSSYQGGSINWSSAKSSGVAFAWTKATEGSTNYYSDADLGINETNGTAAGVLIGAYHYARFDLNSGTNGAAAEAGWFWQVASKYIKTNGAYLMPMLDVEASTSGYTQTTLSQWVNAWCLTVSNLAAASGVVVTPVIYSSSSFAGNWFNSSVTQWIPWIADWNGESGTNGSPTAGTGPWTTWVVWQYDDTNTTFSGVSRSCDVDAFNGSATQLTNTLVIGKAIAPPPSDVTVYWDPGRKNATPGSGGSGTWDNSTTNWWLNGTGDIAWSTAGDYAIFAGTNGTVTLGTSVSADSLTFSNGGYVIAGSSTLTLNSPGNIVTPSGVTNSIQCILGGVAYTLSGGGALYLNNAGNYSFGEKVIGPNTTLQVATDHDAGNDGVTLNLQSGGIYADLDSTSGDQFLLPGSAVALLTGGGIFENPNGNLTMTNYITGAGSLTLVGTTYTLTLTDTGNNYTGGTIVQSGTLKASAAGTLGSTSGALTVSGGTLDLGGVSQTAGTVTISGGTISDGTLTGSSYAGQSGTVSAILAGSGTMTKTTSGTLTLSGANTYSGITTITGGLLQINADTRLGAAPSSPVTNQITLNNAGISSGVRCNGSFTFSSNRGITLVGSGGSVQATSGVTVNYPCVITGSGNLGIGSAYNLGYGINVFTGANNYAGTTTIAAGTLQLGANGTLPAGTPLTIAADGNTGGGGIFDLNGHSQTIGPLTSSTGIGGTGTDTPIIKLTGALTVNQTSNTTFAGVVIGASGSLTLNGTGALTLSASNTYSGNTIISAGTLALASTGSINNTPTISISAGATFDVSAISSYSWSGVTTLNASGTSTPATIKGGTTVNLGSQPIILTYDGSHPALTISQGILSLNGNAFTVNGSILPVGTYTLIQQTSGSSAGAGNYSVSGTAIGAAGTQAAISVSGGSVLLTILNTTTTTLNPLTPSTYGQTATFTANIAPAPPGGTVQFYDNGVMLGGPITVSGGTAAYSTNTLLPGNHPITAAYSGMTGYAASATLGSSIQQIYLPSNSVPVTISGMLVLSNGNVQMNLSGEPGYTYLIQAATSLVPPVTWTTLNTNTADINGLFNFTDLNATNYHNRYYRTAVQ